MQFPDLINGLFELVAGVLSSMNVRAIYRDRGYSGVHWLPTALFSSWGLWNLYYYPHLDQWLSFFGGLSICGVNLTWLYLAFYYGPKHERRPREETYTNTQPYCEGLA